VIDFIRDDTVIHDIMIDSRRSPHDCDDWDHMVNIVSIELPNIKLLRFFPQINTVRYLVFRFILFENFLGMNRLAGNLSLVIILLNESNFPDLITDILETLLFKFAHKNLVTSEL